MLSTIFETRGLTKRYGRKKALDGLDIRLQQGHIYGLVGNNGAGKTTLLRILSGLSRSTGGEISLFGGSSAHELRKARTKMGFLIETPAFFDDLSIDQNLAIQSILRFRYKDKALIANMRELAGITVKETGNIRLGHCSTGQKQRYGIASAIMGNPEFLVLDEPFNGLDPAGVHHIREVLLDIHSENGTTMLVSSHLLEDLYKFATDYIFIDHGKIIEVISQEELSGRLSEGEETNLEEYFLEIVRKHSAGGNL